MELRNIKTFLKVSDLQSFSHAAQSLGYSQSAVTMQIQQLEEELSVRLFDRIGRKIRLTDEGRIFAEHAAEILRSVQAAKESVNKSEEITGALRIGVVESLAINILPSALLKFQKICPRVEVIIKTDTTTTEELCNRLTANEVDVAYFLDRPLYHPEWVKVLEKPQPAYFVASSGHPLAAKSQVSLEEILAEPMVLTERSISYRYELEQALAQKGYELHPVLEAGNTDLIVNMLLNNGGISFVPHYSVRDYIEAGDLSLINCSDVDIHVFTQLIYHKRKWITPQLETFIKILSEIPEA